MSPRCRCARPTWSPSRSWSPSRRSGCWRWSRRAGRRGAGGLRQVADRVGGDRRGHRLRPSASSRRRGRRRPSDRLAGRRLPALRPRAGRAGGLDLRQPGDARARRRFRARLLGLLASPASPPSTGPSSSTTRSSARARCAARRPPTRRCCRCRRRGRDRGRDRRQRPAGRLRPLQRHDRGGARVRPEPGLRRRRAARPDQLPELRQPGEADPPGS